MSNDSKPREIKPASSAEQLNGMPEFAKAIRGLSRVTKAEADKKIAESAKKTRQ
jgi:hypothetical protein